MRRVAGVLIAAASLSATQAMSAPVCWDAVVVARLVDQTPTPVPDAEEGAFIVRWPWNLTFVVEDVLAGRGVGGRIKVVASQHAGFNTQIQHHLLFLTRGSGGRYSIVDHEYRVVVDDAQQFALPLDRPEDPAKIAPQGWVPSGYAQRTRDIRYAPRDAWWLDLGEEEGRLPEDLPDPAWGKMVGDRIVATRGLVLEDLVPDFKARLCTR